MYVRIALKMPPKRFINTFVLYDCIFAFAVEQNILAFLVRRMQRKRGREEKKGGFAMPMPHFGYYEFHVIIREKLRISVQ